MYKQDLALINRQWLICHKPNQTQVNHTHTHTHICTSVYLKTVNICEKRVIG